MLNVECEACRSKGPEWPSHLDFSKLTPYQTCCLWCNGTKQVTSDVAEVFSRLSNQPGVLTVRANSLMSRAIDAKNAWDTVRTKKRPRGHSEIEWAAMLVRTEKAAWQAIADAWEAAALAKAGNAHV